MISFYTMGRPLSLNALLNGNRTFVNLDRKRDIFVFHRRGRKTRVLMGPKRPGFEVSHFSLSFFLNIGHRGKIWKNIGRAKKYREYRATARPDLGFSSSWLPLMGLVSLTKVLL